MGNLKKKFKKLKKKTNLRIESAVFIEIQIQSHRAEYSFIQFPVVAEMRH